MTILQSLERYYNCLSGVAEPGWSPEKFGWCIVLDRDGQPVDVQDAHDLSGEKPRPKVYTVPAAVKRTRGVAPNLFWDKTAYVLGRTGGEGNRTAQEHLAFVDAHLRRLADAEDDGLIALRRFLERWTPDRFDVPPFRPEMLDSNIMFRLDGDCGYLHERPAARTLIAEAKESGEVLSPEPCLVTGERAAPVRLHPTIKGVEGAQSSGAALVSFNLDAFTSLGKEQGVNAPTSHSAAIRYGAALNQLLARNGPNRLRRPVGDATVVFWAEANRPAAAKAADTLFAQWLDGDIVDGADAANVRKQMEAVAEGQPLEKLRPDIASGTRLNVLGLSPNAARLSVRFWLTGDFDRFAQALARHHADLRMEPQPYGWGAAPSVNRLLVNTTALQREFKHISPLLAGEVMRAVLSGGRYPRSLLAAALMRLRAGDSAASGWHAAVIRAVLVRDHRFGFYRDNVPMSLDREHRAPGYLLGRLFAVYELAQRAALGPVNVTIRDKYFGVASAAPASVFPRIVRAGQKHLTKVRQGKPRWAMLIERELKGIHNGLESKLPRSLGLLKQGEFAIGYYHQRATKLSNDQDESLGDHIDHTHIEGNDQ